MTQAGGTVVYMSGSSVSKSVHGQPDVGLTTMMEMVQKIRAAMDSRARNEFVVSARTDRDSSRVWRQQSNGHRHIGMWAQTFCSSKRHVTEGGEMTMFTADELGAMGYGVVLFSGYRVQACLSCHSGPVCGYLESGTQQHRIDEIVSWEVRNKITGLERIRRWEDEYGAESSEDD